MVRPLRLVSVAVLGVSAIALSVDATFARFSDQAAVTAQVGAGFWSPQVPSECDTDLNYNVIEGTAAGEVLNGTVHPDLIFGYGGDDTIRGGNQDDCLVGGPGDDVLFGENGRDVLLGGDGTDICDPGNGPDGPPYCEVLDETN